MTKPADSQALRSASIIAVGTILAFIMVGLLAERLDSTGGPYVPPDCSDVTVTPDTTISVRAKFETERVDRVELRTSVEINMPKSWTRSADLLESSDSSARRSLLACLLGYYPTKYDDDKRYWEERPSEPVVRTSDRMITVNYSATAQIIDQRDIRVGLFRFSFPGPWLDSGSESDIAELLFDAHPEAELILSYPASLLSGRWSSVSVETPPDWISNPRPWPPTTMTPTVVTWAPLMRLSSLMPCENRDLSRDDECLWMTVHMSGPRYVSLYLSSYYLPGSILATVSDLIGYVIIGVWLHRRVGRQFTPTSIARRGLIPLPVLALLTIVVGTVNRVLLRLSDPPWLTSDWIINVLCCIVILSVGILWKLDRRAAMGTFGTAIALLVLIAAVAGGFPLVLDSAARGDVQGMAGLLAWQAFLTATLLLAGILNAARLLVCELLNSSNDPVKGQAGTSRKFENSALNRESTCWLIAALCAFVLVIERAVVVVMRTSQVFWLSSSPPPVFQTYSIFGSLVPDIVNSCLDLVALLAVLAAIVLLLTGRYNYLEPQFVIVLAVAFFLVEWWWVWFWGWTVPIWVLLLPITIMAFRAFRTRSSRYGRVDSPLLTSGGRQEVSQVLKKQARIWRMTVRHGRAAEKRLSQGDLGIGQYRGRLDKAEREIATANSSIRRVISAARKEGVSRYVEDHVQPDATPIDILLSVGPRFSPAGNALYAAKVATLWSMPVTLPMTIFTLVTAQLSVLYSTTTVMWTLDTALWLQCECTVLGALIGASWEYLPGRRGPIRVLPLVLLFSITPLAGFLLPYVFGGAWSFRPLLEVFLMLAVATAVGLAS